jgi:hypothetical protein
MTTFIPTAILLFSLAGGYGGAGMSGGVYGSTGVRAGEPGDNMDNLLLRLQTPAYGLSRQDRVLRTAFVVPGPDLTPEGIGQISEDLAVMCRIFDKAAVWADSMPMGYPVASTPLDVSGIEIAQDRVVTQALYLDGYGAVFFLPVDFLLAAPQEEKKEPKAERSDDPLWSQTADELRGVSQRPPKSPILAYNPQRVENLKIALLGTLRHAANLRIRQAEDAISIAIATRLSQADRQGWIFSPSTPRFSQQQTVAPTGVSPDLPTVLVLRTTKADVDALAKGSLSQEQFAAKVQTLKSWTSPGPPEAGMGGFGGGGIMGGGSGMGGGMRMPSQNR